MTRNFKIRDATVADIPIILQLIRDLATYERAPDDVVATEKGLHEVLFGAEPAARVVIAFENTEPIGFAVIFLISPPGLVARVFIWKICLSNRRCAVAVTAVLCWCTWQRSRAITIAGEWNGPSSPGTSRRFNFITN
jgi:hypothetical protein